MTSEQVAQDIDNHITKWQREKNRLIVAIDGYSGSGKTTVLNYLARQNSSILAVHLDEFITHWKVRKQMMDSARDRSLVFEYKWYRYQELVNLLRAFKRNRGQSMAFRMYDFERNDFGATKVFDLSKPVLVIEGILLFHPRIAISKLLDKRVYLAVDFAKADRRRVAREKKQLGGRYVSENHPDSYIVPFKVAYRRYVSQFNPAGIVDVVYKIT
jgi:uridine kinase